MNIRKWLMLLLFALLPAQFAIAQFADLKAEIQVSDWQIKRLNTWTTSVHCVVGTNSWQMEGDFSRNASVSYWFTGTNIIEENVVTKDLSEDVKDINRPGFPYVTAPAIGTRSKRYYESIDGNPGRTVRNLDQLTMVARVGWLAFCSGPALRREGRQIFPPSDLWKELVCTDHFVDRTTTFQDSLGLPETMDLYTTNSQMVVQYRATSSTNIMGWQFPLAFELVQYRPAPVPGFPHITEGTNGWELQFIAKGKVDAVNIGTAPHSSER